MPSSFWQTPRFVRYAVVVALIATAAFHVWSLTRVPSPFVDEAWFASRAWSFLNGAGPLGSLDEGAIDDIPGAWRAFPVLPVILQAGVLWIAGTPSLIALRMLSLGAGLLLAASIWHIVRHTYDATAAWVAVTILCFSQSFAYSSHLARYDMMASSLGFLGLAAYITSSRRASLQRFLGTFAVGCSIEFHPFAVVFTVAVLALIVFDYRRHVYSTAEALFSIAGLGLAGLLFAAIHLLPTPSAYLAVAGVIYGPTHVPRLVDAATGVVELFWVLVLAYSYAAPIAIWSLIVLLRSAEVRDRRLAIAGMALSVAFALLVRNKFFYYGVLFCPVFAITAGVAVTRLVRSATSPRRVIVRLFCTVGPLLAGIISCIVIYSRDRRSDFDTVVGHLRTVVGPQETIIGSQAYWFGLWQHRYLSWEQLVYRQRRYAGTSAIDALEALNADVLVRDAQMDSYVLDHAGPSAYTQLLRLPRKQLDDWLAGHAVLVADFHGGVYGRIRVYRIR